MTLPTPFYDQDGITIFNADCRDVLPELEAPDLVIADPPYGVRAVQRNSRTRKVDTPAIVRGLYSGTWRGWEDIHGDDGPFDPSHLLHYSRLVLFGANHYADRLPASGSWLVWDKRNGATPDDNADAELMWTNLGGVVRIYRQCWRGFTRENDALEMTERHLHPTQKPVALMHWLLERYSRTDALIVDPYMGCGPVMRAAKNLGRRAIGIEINEDYCAITVDRLRQGVLL